MPDRPPSEFDDQSAWTSYCIPFMMDEGMPNDQAVAACLQMWRDRRKKGYAFVGTGEVTSATLNECPPVTRAYSLLTVKSVQEDERVIRGVATTPETDRIGDIVESLGIEFKNPLPLLLHHQHDKPVGSATFDPPTAKGITFTAKIAKIAEPGVLKDRVDEAWQSLKAGLIKGVSIGFKPRDWERLEDGNGYRFLKSLVYELSLVTIPANASATIGMIRSLDTDDLAASGRSANRPGATGKASNNPVKLKERTAMSKTIGEQVEALTAARAAKEARMEAIMSKSMEEGRSTDESEQEEFDGLRVEVEKLDGDIQRFSALDKINRAKAVPVKAEQTVTQEAGAAARGGYIRVVGPTVPPGIRWARVAKCLYAGQGNRMNAMTIAESTYPDDPGIADVFKAAVSAGTTSNPQWASPLVQEGGPAADFLEWLRPQTIFGRFGAGGIPGLTNVPFRVPLITQTSGGDAYWTAEGAAKGLTAFSFSRTQLEPLKVANIAVSTEELLASSSPAAETIIRNQLAAALRARIDQDFVDPANAGASNVKPASITNGVATIPSSGVTADAVRADILAVMAPFVAANNPPNQGVWLMAWQTAAALSMMTTAVGSAEFSTVTPTGGTLQGMPIIVSEYIGTGGGSPNTKFVWLVNASDLYVGQGELRLDLSREASLVMDSAPVMSSAEVGSPSAPTGASSMVSMFQTNSVAFRCEMVLSWARRRPEAVQGLSGVVWGT